MPEEPDSAPRWWFKNVIVPLASGGGIAAVFLAWWLSRPPNQQQMSSTTGSTTTASTGSTKAPIPFTILIKAAPVTDRTRAYFSLTVTVDNKIAGVLSSNENTVVDTIKSNVPSAETHTYEIKGRVQPDSKSSSVGAYGTGKIDIADGATFAVDGKQPTDADATFEMHLVRIDHQ